MGKSKVRRKANVWTITFPGRVFNLTGTPERRSCARLTGGPVASDTSFIEWNRAGFVIVPEMKPVFSDQEGLAGSVSFIQSRCLFSRSVRACPVFLPIALSGCHWASASVPDRRKG